jgi:catechol 2,3-dioxygenase-like lactoylglutathione lyase family enzyme
MKLKLDHSVIHVSDRSVSDAFYREVLGAELVGAGGVRMYRFGDAQLNVHGPGLDAGAVVARIPVPPGGSDLCFEWPGAIADAVAHLEKLAVPIEFGGPRKGFGARGLGDSVYFRDPDGALLEFISYPPE